MQKVIIVTGSSRGIGAATAIKAASLGYKVCVNYMRNDAAANAIVDLIYKNGGQAIAVKADVSKELEVEKLFKVVDKELGVLTALVNNVGILEPKMRVEEINLARLERIFSTNIASYFLCAREAVRRMSTIHGGKGGAIVNVSSAASRLGSAGEYVDYAASKGAIDTLTIGLSVEVANENIRVNGVRPGFILTDIHASGGEPDRVNRIKTQLPMQRGGEPAEVANAILWLLSEEASYVTGSFIDLAGGK
ncbi:MAG TPA: SDR family oxidoreductase [Gammaproteobacteria bacterium]|nr:SDR family oxidoreductase [Gammaproteobacteria bacterium]